MHEAVAIMESGHGDEIFVLGLFAYFGSAITISWLFYDFIGAWFAISG